MSGTDRSPLRLARLNASKPGRIALTFVLAAFGGGLFAALGSPAGWIAGSILCVAIASLAGLQTQVPNRARRVIYFFLGILIGSAARPQLLDQIAIWPYSFAILAVAMLAIIFATTFTLHRVYGWDLDTAFFAGMPGALSIALATAENTRADMRLVAVTQSVRLLVLVQLLPLAILLEFGQGNPAASMATSVAQSGSPLWDYVLLILFGLVGVKLISRTGIPGADLLGSMLASAILYITGIVEIVLPHWMVIAGVVGLGAVAGSRFRPGDWPVIRGAALPVLSAFLLGITLSILAAILAANVTGVPLPQALIAFAPGALDALTVLAFTMELDPAYVAAHHVVRMFFLALTIPILGRWIHRAAR